MAIFWKMITPLPAGLFGDISNASVESIESLGKLERKYFHWTEIKWVTPGPKCSDLAKVQNDTAL